MDYATSVWQLAIIALIAGAMLGALAYRLFSPSIKQAHKIKADLEQTRGELTSYKVSVGQHFDRTSELVNDLTQNYVRVYQHLAEGALTLGGNKVFSNLLEQHQGKVAIEDTTDTVADDSHVEATEALTEKSDSEVASESGEAKSDDKEIRSATTIH